MSEAPLTGRVALVTGASRGIGKAAAVSLAAAGADVCLVARNSELLDAVAGEIRELGRRAVVCAGDLCDPEFPKQAVEKATEELGGLDILVNNAGVTRDGLLARMPDEDWQAVMDTNLASAFRLVREATRSLMRSKHGRVINVASVVGITGNAGQANYAASKGGLIAFTKSVARELAGRKVTANVVAPGWIETDMTENLPEQVREKGLAGIPMRRFGVPEDISGVISFLASDDASYLTAQVIAVDGGMT